MTITVSKDFSCIPGPRYATQGTFSGELFRDTLLIPALLALDVEKQEKVAVDLDGAYGYPTSWLEEVFGGAVRKLADDKQHLIYQLDIVSTEDNYLIPQIIDMVKDALENRNKAKEADEKKTEASSDSSPSEPQAASQPETWPRCAQCGRFLTVTTGKASECMNRACPINRSSASETACLRCRREYMNDDNECDYTGCARQRSCTKCLLPFNTLNGRYVRTRVGDALVCDRYCCAVHIPAKEFSPTEYIN